MCGEAIFFGAKDTADVCGERWRAAGGWGVDGTGEPWWGVFFFLRFEALLLEETLTGLLCNWYCGSDTWLPV